MGVAIGIYDAFEDVSVWKSVSSSSLNFDGSGKTVMGWGRIKAEEGRSRLLEQGAGRDAGESNEIRKKNIETNIETHIESSSFRRCLKE